MPMKVTNARIACLDFNLNKYKCGWGVSVQINEPAELEKIR